MLSCVTCSWSLHQPVFSSIFAALGEARIRRRSGSRTSSVMISLELSWQWRIVVFRCWAQMGDDHALSFTWIGRWFPLAMPKLSFRTTSTYNYVSILLDKFHHWYGQPQVFPKIINHCSHWTDHCLVSLIVIILRLILFSTLGSHLCNRIGSFVLLLSPFKLVY